MSPQVTFSHDTSAVSGHPRSLFTLSTCDHLQRAVVTSRHLRSPLITRHHTVSPLATPCHGARVTSNRVTLRDAPRDAAGRGRNAPSREIIISSYDVHTLVAAAAAAAGPAAPAPMSHPAGDRRVQCQRVAVWWQRVTVVTAGDSVTTVGGGAMTAGDNVMTVCGGAMTAGDSVMTAGDSGWQQEQWTAGDSGWQQEQWTAGGSGWQRVITGDSGIQWVTTDRRRRETQNHDDSGTNAHH